MTVFSYHSLTDDWEDDLAVRPKDFSRQMKTLAGMHPMALPDYIEALREKRLPKGAVAVTFDDGYANNLHVALPICERFGIRPTMFIAVGHVDSGEPIGWRPETRECNRPLNWDEVRRLHDAGWTIGSHTMGHSDLVTAPDDRLVWELNESRRRISEMLGTECRTMSYPYGRHDERVRKATEDAGYDAGLSMPTGREFTDDRMAIPRIGVFLSEGRLRFQAKARGIVLPMKLRIRPAFAPQGSDGAREDPDTVTAALDAKRAYRTASQTALVMAIIAVTSLAGFGREIAFAARFGTSAAADAWGSAAAVLAVATELLLLSGPIAVLAIPALTERRMGDDPRLERRALTALMIVMVGTAGIVAALMVLGRGTFAALLAPGYTGARRVMLTGLLGYVGAAIAPIAAAGTLAAALASRHRFARPALTGLAMHLSILTALVLFVPESGLVAVGVAVIVGSILQLLLQTPALRVPGIGKEPDWSAIHDIGKFAVPLIAIFALRESTLVLERVFASTLPTGELATLYFAGKLEQFPLGLFATTVSVVAYPAFAELAFEGRTEQLGEAIARALRLVLLLAVPSAVGLAVLAHPIVDLLFGHGEFDAQAVAATSAVLLPLSFGLVGQSTVPPIMRGFFSLKQLRAPILVMLGVIGLNVLLDATLVRFGAIGLGSAFAITMTIAVLALATALARRVPFVSKMGLAKLSAQLVAGGLALALSASAAYWGLHALLGDPALYAQALATFAGIIVGVLVYGGVLYATGLDEFRRLSTWRAHRHTKDPS